MDAMLGGPCRWMRYPVVLAVLAASLFASSPASAARTEFYGITQQTPFDSQDLQDLGTLRVQTDRFVVIWGSVEPSQGSFRWGPTDNRIGSLASRGIRSVPTLWGNPDWVAGVNARPPIDTTAAQQAWQGFLKAVVARYGPGGSYWTNVYPQKFPGATPLPVKSWQVWNEPNLTKYFAPAPSASEYARLLQISYPAIKSVDPNALVVLGGIVGYRDVYAWNYLNSLYGVSGVKSYFDAVALHPYAPTLDEVRMVIANVRAVMKSHSDGATPIWITEIAWGSASNLKGLTGQAQMLTDAFNMIKNNRNAWNIQRLFWYQLRDPDAPVATCTFCDSAGLVNLDHTRKPSFSAYKAFSAETTPPTVSITSGPAAASFTKDSTPTFTFSSNETGVTFSCHIDASAFKACASPYTAAALSNGPHTLYVKAIDAAGNEGTTLSRRFTVDTVSPTVTAPGQSLAAGTQLGQGTVPVRLAWLGTDNLTSAANLKFDLNRRSSNGSWSPWSAVLTNSAQKTLSQLLSPGTSYQYQARSRDQAGNASAFRSGTAFTPRLFQETSATYVGLWGTQSQSDASGGAVKTSSQPGATATFTVTTKSLGVVMPLRSTLGAAQICLDPGTASQSCATVDLSPASGLGARMLVFVRNGLPSVQHKIRVTVQSGRAELDALATVG
jgi:Glycosyl hydrolase catalytic core/Bacterial Ig-like domain